MKFSLLVFITFFFIILNSCKLPDSIALIGSNPQLTYGREGYFGFRPENYSTGINSEKDFTLYSITKNQLEEQKKFGKIIKWKEKDFVLITQIVHQKIWNKSVNDIKLSEVSFTTSCLNIDSGLQNGLFTFFEIEKPDKNDVGRRIEHHIHILPSEGLIHWYETYISINDKGESFLDFSHNKVTSDNALFIAEENGGKDVRLKNANKCNINVFSGLAEKDLVWHINYTPTVISDEGIIFSTEVKAGSN
jgi:hypothetical protein